MSLDDSSIESRVALLEQLLSGCLHCDDNGVSLTLLARDGLLDTLLVLYDECCRHTPMQNKRVAAFVKKYEGTVKEVRRLRVRVSDFEVKDVIGRGHFGEVQVVRDVHTETVYAMKTLRKQETLAQPEISFFEEERDIMATATSPWLTKLHYAFHDAHTLYLIMEFHAGGDLLSLLSRHDDVFEEKMARFYLAEIVLATHDLHKMGYVHRDLKPENVLLDCHGHVKLADFGSAAKLSPDGLVSSKMPVGTPDYVSPELLNAMNGAGLQCYGTEVDWWSLGVCMYEMLYGKTPFTDEAGSMVSTYANIMNYKSCLKFPSDTAVSTLATQLIKGLLVEKQKRLDYSSIRKHAFFSTTDWDNITQETPPFVPQLQGLDDTSNFEEFEKIKHSPVFDDGRLERDFSGKDLPFVGFTYNKKQKKLDKDVPGKNIDIGTSVHTSRRKSSTNVDVNFTVKIAELGRLKEKYHALEETECGLRSQLERLRLTVADRDEEVARLTHEGQATRQDLENYIAKTNRLSKQLEVMVEERAAIETKSEMMMAQIKDMSSEATQIEDEIHKLQLEELQEVVCQLEEEKMAQLRKLSQRDREIATYRDQLTTTRNQLHKLQTNMEKERRKSRGEQKREFTLLETREEVWKSQLEERTAENRLLNVRIKELEDVVEALESAEADYMEREQKLRQQLQDSEDALAAREQQQLQKKEDQQKNQQAPHHRDNVDIRVSVRRSSPSPKKERKFMDEKMKELEDRLDQYEKEKQAWEKKEEDMTETIERLKCDVLTKVEKERLSSEMKKNLLDQMRSYQQEIQEQKERIKELHESVKLCLSDSDDEKSRKLNRLERQIKDLEEQLDSYRSDKRRLLAEAMKHHQEVNDKEFTLKDLERKNVRLTSKVERLERQLSETREKEFSLRMKRNSTSDLRIRLAEERVSDMEKEKEKLEAKVLTLSRTIDDLKTKQTDAEDKNQSAMAKTLNENLDLKKQLDHMQRSVEKFEKQVTRCERTIFNLEDEIKTKNLQIQQHKAIREKNADLEKQIKSLETRISVKEELIKSGQRKEEELTKMTREKENLETKIKSMEKSMEESKRKSAGRSLEKRRSEDWEQEKSYLEARVSSLRHQLETADTKIVDMGKQLAAASLTDNKVTELEDEVGRLKKDKLDLEAQLRETRQDLERRLKQQTDTRQDARAAEEKLEKVRDEHADIADSLRKELNLSNLALSEARSLLAATQRQERNTRDQLEADIRQLNQRIFLLSKEKGLTEDRIESENYQKQSEQSSMQALRSENEALQKKQKELEEKLSSAQREKTAFLMEKHMLKDNLAQREAQCQSESQKVEKLRGICSELEGQIRDLEALQADQEAREAEWSEARRTYETAVQERESELEGAQQRLAAISQSRQSSHEIAQTVKQQLQSAKDKHRADVETLKRQVADLKQQLHKQNVKYSDLESHNSKLQMVVDQQKVVMDGDGDEKRRLKEEISKVLTENQEVKSKNIKLRQNLEEAIDKLEMIFGEKIDLENFTETLQGLHFLEKYRFESTIGQQMKLIDYLQDLWQDTVTKKKKSHVFGNLKGGKLFGKGGKDGAGTMPNLPIMGDLQAALDQETKRNRQLQEQLDRLRADNLTQANELLKVKGILREKNALGDTNITANVQVLFKSPAPTRSSSKPSPSNSHSQTLLTPQKTTSKALLAPPPGGPTPQRIHHKIPHRFVTGLNTRATKCGVCLGSVHFVKQAAKCQECSMVCHPRCSSSAPATCGLPSEYMSHLSAMTGPAPSLPSGSKLAPTQQENISINGWLKVPKGGKHPGWERRWCLMEKNILMLFTNDCDANPVDTFDMGPPETDVTVHSAVSMAELPSTAATDLPYVLRLEHEPLTTCWPGRILYLLAPSFKDKQRWVASLEAAIKRLQRNDKTKRQRVEMNSLLELSGDKRLELNCCLLLSKQLTVLGAEEGLYAINVRREPPVLTRLPQFEAVHSLHFIPSLNLVILLSGQSRRIITIDKKLIQLRLGQSDGVVTQPVPHNVVEGVSGVTVLDVGTVGDTAYLCVGTVDKVVIMKYNPELRMFCVRKELEVREPCSCVCVTDNFAIVGTDRFYKINLEHPTLSGFVDKQDSSLAFAAFGAATHHSYPLAVVRVSPDGLPLEFLLCFHEFGVYVDSKGQRSRPADMKWSCLPLSFAYREPFLYVTYFTSVQAITVPASKEQIRGKQTLIDLSCPRYLGAALEHGTVYVASSSGVSTELLSICGKDGTIIEPIGKENRHRGVVSGTGSWSSRQQPGTRKPSSAADKYRSNPNTLVRKLSISSVDSSSSVSSSSTLSSHSSEM